MLHSTGRPEVHNISNNRRDYPRMSAFNHFALFLLIFDLFLKKKKIPSSSITHAQNKQFARLTVIRQNRFVTVNLLELPLSFIVVLYVKKSPAAFYFSSSRLIFFSLSLPPPTCLHLLPTCLSPLSYLRERERDWFKIRAETKTHPPDTDTDTHTHCPHTSISGQVLDNRLPAVSASSTAS